MDDGNFNVDALIDAATPEQIERIVSAWTRKAEAEVAQMSAPIEALVDSGAVASCAADLCRSRTRRSTSCRLGA